MGMDGMVATMITHNAGWHKTCCLKFNKTKLEHLGKKSSAEVTAHISSAVHTRSSCSKVDLTEATCILCAIPAGSACFHECSTYDIDMRVHRRYAMELEDTAPRPSLHLGI